MAELGAHSCQELMQEPKGMGITGRYILLWNILKTNLLYKTEVSVQF